MGFLISRTVGFLFLPSNLIAFVGVLGLLLLILRLRRCGRVLIAVSIVALVLAGWSPLNVVALKTLEDRFPPPRIEGPVAGIVMLGGAVNVHISRDRGAPALNDAAERITSVARLARQYPDARILLSGGAHERGDAEHVTESAIGRSLLVSMGVDPGRIETEERSLNTFQNAEQSLATAKPAPGQVWLLVTSASHMPRAVACFRAVGFPVVPYPVDYRTRLTPWSILPISTGLELLDLAAHEWIGLVVYRLMGRTEDLFPAP